jgi:hypothetical protein
MLSSLLLLKLLGMFPAAPLLCRFGSGVAKLLSAQVGGGGLVFCGGGGGGGSRCLLLLLIISESESESSSLESGYPWAKGFGFALAFLPCVLRPESEYAPASVEWLALFE